MSNWRASWSRARRDRICASKLWQSSPRSGHPCWCIVLALDARHHGCARFDQCRGPSGSGPSAQFFAAGALFLKPCSQPTFFRFVRENFPEKLADYERRYGASAWVSPEYRERMADLVNSICRQYKLGKRYVETPSNDDRVPDPPRIEVQPWLPFGAAASNQLKAS